MEELSGQRILVTGFTGRLGGAFAEKLATSNSVTGVALQASDEELEAWRRRGVEPYVVDLASGDYGDLPADFDYVVHTAAAVYPRTLEDGIRANAEAPALLMQHVRGAKAFLHVSTTGVYTPSEDPHYRSVETDPIGGMARMGHYTGTKAAGEGAVCAMARVLELPTVICRMDVQYGTHADGGMPVKRLADVINGRPINLPGVRSWIKSLIHEDDLFSFVAPCLARAAVPAVVVNWAGDEAVVAEDWIGHLGKLVGREPVYEYDEPDPLAGGAASADFRISITGPAQLGWREGLARIAEYWEPRIRSGEYVAAGPAGVV